MKRLWLILDANFLCWRGHHAIGPLSTSTDIRTEVTFSFLRDIQKLQDLHNTRNIAFCFDRAPYKREEIYPEYKQRPEIPKHEQVKKDAVRRQINMLRTVYLPQLGFRNIFSQKGYEADDIIASLCQNLPEDERAVIIGRDHDLYQLLSNQVMMWDPISHEPMTGKLFRHKYGIKPKDWALVKCLMGCKGDRVAGVPGVAEVTAIRFVRDELPLYCKAYATIRAFHRLIKRNRKLVKLPFPGVKTFKLREDRFSQTGLNKLIKELELYSLRNM